VLAEKILFLVHNIFGSVNDNEWDVVGLQVATAGPNIQQELELLKEQGDNEGTCFYRD
jgi:hypothetical protein